MLTEKEIKVLELKNRGFKQSEIAQQLGISQPAVSSFLNNAYRKIKAAKEVLEIVEKMPNLRNSIFI